MNKIPNTFPITVFEDSSEKISDTLTQKRVRIFYKGANRNGGYISDDFAESLIETLPYAPVKGIYDEDEEDFEGHGEKRTQGKIYGVVPDKSKMDFAWEKHLDEDGVEREYACTNVYLFTALYDEANEIDGKGQSMELYGPSITGTWENINGTVLFKYKTASFLGLQVLGDNATPCFQGSAFYTLENQQFYTMFTTLLEKIENLEIGGNQKVEKEKDIVFALSDNQKQNEIFKCLNKDKYQYFVMDTYDDYAIVYDFESEKTFKVAYTKNEDDSVSVSDEMEEVYSIYVTKDEKERLDEYRKKRECTLVEAFEKLDECETKISDLETEIGNKDTELSTLKTEKESLSNKVSDLETEKSNFEAQVNILTEFKLGVEKKEKEGIIDRYTGKLADEILSTYREKLDTYTVTDLDKDLAYELVKSNDALFEKTEKSGYVPVETPVAGVEAILAKYVHD